MPTANTRGFWKIGFQFFYLCGTFGRVWNRRYAVLARCSLPHGYLYDLHGDEKRRNRITTIPGDKLQWTQMHDSSRQNFRPSLNKRRLRHSYILKQTSSQFELSEKEYGRTFRRPRNYSSGSYSLDWYAADSNAAQPFAIESSIEVKERAGFTTLRRPCLPSR